MHPPAYPVHQQQPISAAIPGSYPPIAVVKTQKGRGTGRSLPVRYRMRTGLRAWPASGSPRALRKAPWKPRPAEAPPPRDWLLWVL